MQTFIQFSNQPFCLRSENYLTSSVSEKSEAEEIGRVECVCKSIGKKDVGVFAEKKLIWNVSMI